MVILKKVTEELEGTKTTLQLSINLVVKERHTLHNIKRLTKVL